MHEFEIENTNHAIAFWACVPPDAVSSSLNHFRKYPEGCGTLPTCERPGWLDSWLIHIPHFRDLGVRAGRNGIPYYREAIGSYAFEVLFGWSDLWYLRGEKEKGTDHEVVAHRLRYNLLRLRGEPGNWETYKGRRSYNC